MTMRLWNYVSTFSNLSGEKLHQIYSKLKQEQDDDAGIGPSHVNGSAYDSVDVDSNYFPPFSRNDERQRGYKNATSYAMPEAFNKGHHDAGRFEAWKRRRRAEADMQSPFQVPFQRPTINGTRLTDSNALGILGAGPSDNRQFVERPYRMRQTGFPPRQNFSSGIK